MKEYEKYLNEIFNNDMKTHYIPKNPNEAFQAWKDKVLQVQNKDGKWEWVVGAGQDFSVKQLSGLWWDMNKDKIRAVYKDFR
jgi:hypothetical protein